MPSAQRINTIASHLVADLRETVRREYDEQSVEKYDNITTQGWRDMELFTFDKAVKVASRGLAEDASRDLRILDLACGNGRATRLLAAYSGAGSVIGVDFSQTMVDDANRIEAEASTGKSTYDVRDIFNLGIVAGGNFDVINVTFGLHYAASEQMLLKCLADSRRNLKQGGAFVLIGGHPDRFTNMPSPKFLNANYALVGFKMKFPQGWPPKPFDSVVYEIFADGVDTMDGKAEPEYRLTCSFVPIGTYERLFLAAGFSRVERIHWTYAGRDEGDTNPYLERVLSIEPHMCMVAWR